MKWWLISDEDVNTIRKALEAPIQTEMCSCCDSVPVSERTETLLEKTLHTLDSGLHITDAVPADFA